MKKLILTGFLFLSLSFIKKEANASDTPQDQILASLLQHVVGVTEFTSHGNTKLEFLDGILQFGHYEGDYIFALDGGFANSVTPDAAGRLSTTWGGHIHLISAFNNLTGLNPSLGIVLDHLELTPRWSYDTDVRHGVFGVTFGAVIPF